MLSWDTSVNAFVGFSNISNVSIGLFISCNVIDIFQKMSIFYRDRLGKYPYISHDGKMVNGGLPQLGDLADHLYDTVTQLSTLLHPDFSGMAVIDWEEWHPLWWSNFGSKMEYRRLSKVLVRQERPDLLDEDVTLLARQQFEESARMFMEETLRMAVRRRSKGLWGFYGFPSCFNKHQRKTGRANTGPAFSLLRFTLYLKRLCGVWADKTYTGRCHKGTKQQNDQLSWLWAQSTALYPSIYLPQRLAGSEDAALMVRYMRKYSDILPISWYLWRGLIVMTDGTVLPSTLRHRLLESLRVASLWRHDNSTNRATPVLPYARLAFTHTLDFLNKVAADKRIKINFN